MIRGVEKDTATLIGRARVARIIPVLGVSMGQKKLK